MQTLSGHISPETAFLVEDFPYGFRLRCQIRYWLEFKKNHGFRFVSQTTNPKKPGIAWNKPKASTYADCMVMVLTDEGHVEYRVLRAGGWDDEEKILAYEVRHVAALTDDHREAIRFIRASNAAEKYLTYTIRPVSDEEPRQTREDQADILRRAITLGYLDVAAEGK